MNQLRPAARPEHRSLALLAFASGAACLLTALFPPSAQAPVGLVLGLGATAAVAGVLLLVVGPALTMGPTVAVTVLMAVLTSVLVGAATTTGGAMLVGYAYVWLTVYVALLLPRWVTMLNSVVVTVGFGVGLLVSGLPGMLDAWVLVSVTVWAFGHGLARIAARVRHHAETDLLTGLLNRRAFVAAAEREHELAARTGADLAIVLVDLDDFKLVNDRDGHAAGDRLLAELSAAWLEALRPADLLARHGGDEFAVLLPATSEEGADRLVARLRQAHPMTWSAGVSAWRPGESLDTALARADARLYAVKRGRVESQERRFAAPSSAAPRVAVDRPV